MKDLNDSSVQPSSGLRFDKSYRQEIYEALEQRDAGLARMYYGACCTMQQSDNPEREPQVAHSIRELMENAPRYLEVVELEQVVPSKVPHLDERVKHLKIHWDKVTSKSWWGRDPKQDQVLDQPIRKYLDKSESFFGQYSARPSRIRQATSAVSVLDRHRGQVPKPIGENQAKTWQMFHKYFTQASHHGSTEEFDGMVEGFEEFLFSLLKPRTFDDQEKIEALIKKAES